MKVLIPEPSPTTGKGQFISRVMPELANLGVKVTHKPQDSHDLYLDIAKFRFKSKAKKILRLDGCYYDKHSSSHVKINKNIAKCLRQSDAAIYQSEWSKYMCDYYLGKAPGKSAVIHNGADYKFYEGIEPAKSSFKHNFFTASRWRHPKRLKEITKAFLKADIPDSCLWVAGKPNFKVEDKRVKYLGHIYEKEMAKYLKMADAFIHISWVDACPNSVIESLCAGTPVVCNNVGGTPELVSNDGVICKIDKPYNMGRVNHDKPPKIDMDALIRGIRSVVKQGIKVKYNDKFDIKFVAKRYVDFFKLVLNK